MSEKSPKTEEQVQGPLERADSRHGVKRNEVVEHRSKASRDNAAKRRK